MLGFKYSGKVITYFSKLTNRVRVGRYKALYRTAGLIRTTAKRSMRLRPGASTPPAPPHAHTRGGLRQIDFAVDSGGFSAMIGPVKFGRSQFFNEPATHVEEFGGTFFSKGRGTYTYPERSYMGSTLKKLQAKGKISKEFSVNLAKVL